MLASTLIVNMGTENGEPAPLVEESKFFAEDYLYQRSSPYTYMYDWQNDLVNVVN